MDSTGAISQLMNDLAFLRKDLNESIKNTNEKREGENATFLAKISAVQKTTDVSIGNLTMFIKGNLIAQGIVITSLKKDRI